MYCYNCRSIINNGLTKCPQCGADMEIVSDMILDNILYELEKYCPEVNNNAEIFTIGNNKVKLEGDILKISIKNRFVNTLFRSSWEQLSNWMTGNSFNTVQKYGTAKSAAILGVQSFLVGAFLKKSGLNVSPDLINRELAFFKDPTVIVDSLNMIENEYANAAENLRQVRKVNENESHMKWMGGGFGIESAIAGAVNAQILNLGTSVIHGAWKALKEGTSELASKAVFANEKNQIKESKEYREFLFEEWKGHYLPLHWFLSDKLCLSENWEEYESYCLPENELLEIKEIDESFPEVLKKLSRNPLSLPLYARLYDLHPEFGKDLLKLAEYCGIEDMVQNVFAQRFNAEDFSDYTIEEIGFGTPKEKLYMLKQELDYIQENNPAILLKPEMMKYREKVDTTFMMKEICDAVDKASQLLRNNSLSDAVNEIRGSNSELEKDVFFTTYSNRYSKSFKEGDQILFKWEEELANYSDDYYAMELLLIPYFRLQPPGFASEDLMKPIRRMALDGSVQSAAFWGMCLVNGWHTEKNIDLGIEMLNEALSHNNHLALAQVGSFHRQGIHGFNKNLELAKKYLTFADLMGEKMATNELTKL